MIDLKDWMNGVLVNCGIPSSIANAIDELMLVIMLFIACGILNFILERVFVPTLQKLAAKTKTMGDDLLFKYKVIQRCINAVPAFVFYGAISLLLVNHSSYVVFFHRVCALYIVVVLLMAGNGLLKVVLELSENKPSMKRHPLRGMIQVLQVVMFFFGGIIIISIIINKSPVTLFAGLGAAATVLMLVFKDTILGFVAGIQLSANDMVRVGDWIVVPSSNANGIVKEITLNTVKIQNWDNTITTVPPVNLVNGSFQNYRGMQESGGRRVAKTIALDLKSIKFCTPEMIDMIQKNIPLLKDYAPKENESPTNSQIFRYYIEAYLRTVPEVNKQLDIIITQEQSTEYGVPIKIYFFSSNKVWKEYEKIQSDIFDHLLAMLPAFGLKIYQYG